MLIANYIPRESYKWTVRIPFKHQYYFILYVNYYNKVFYVLNIYLMCILIFFKI